MDNFYQFLNELPISESIDAILPDKDHKGVKKADYFFQARKIVCEVKSLNKDTSEKIEHAIEAQKDRKEFPIFYGGWDIKKVLKYFPDGGEIYENLVYAITSPIEAHIKDANRQIRETKHFFNLPKSHGLVIVVNQDVSILDAELLAWRINRCLSKRLPDGSIRFESIEGVLLLDEAHHFLLSRDSKGPMIIHLGLPGVLSKELDEYMSYLAAQWAAWNGNPIVQMEEEEFDKSRIKGKDWTGQNSIPDKLPRHETWRLSYGKNPYLRRLSESQIIEYGRNLIAEISPYFLKNGKPSTKELKMKLLEKFTHLMEEINYRGIDMKRFKLNEMKGILDEIDPKS